MLRRRLSRYKEIQDLQQKIQFAQQSGVEPSEEQIQQFNDVKAKMDASLTIQAYAKAQNELSQFMQDINCAISRTVKFILPGGPFSLPFRTVFFQV